MLRTVGLPASAAALAAAAGFRLIAMPISVGLIAAATLCFALAAVCFDGLVKRHELIAFIAAGVSPLRVSLGAVVATVSAAAVAPLFWLLPGPPSVVDWLGGMGFSALIPLCCCAALPFAVLTSRAPRPDLWGSMLLAVLGFAAFFGVEAAVLHSLFAAYMLLAAVLLAATVALYRAARL